MRTLLRWIPFLTKGESTQNSHDGPNPRVERQRSFASFSDKREIRRKIPPMTANQDSSVGGVLRHF